MRFGIPGLGQISDDDAEHVTRFERMQRTMPGVPDDEAEAAQAASLHLSVERLRQLKGAFRRVRDHAD